MEQCFDGWRKLRSVDIGAVSNGDRERDLELESRDV